MANYDNPKRIAPVLDTMALTVPAATPAAIPNVLSDGSTPDSGVPLKHYLWILKRHWWRMLLFVICCMVAVFIVSSRITPLYESTAKIDIDRQDPLEIVGQDPSRGGSADEDFMNTQAELIESDAVLRPVAEKYHLFSQTDSGAGIFAWFYGGRRSKDEPIRLKRLRVIRSPETNILLIRYRSRDPLQAAEVANAIARSYLEQTFELRLRSATDLSDFGEKQLESLKTKMVRSSNALSQFEKELNVVNPDEKTSTLSARLLQLNTQYTDAEADRVAKQAAYDAVKSGSLEAAQASDQGQALQHLTEHLAEVEERFEDVKSRFGTNFPDYKKYAQRVAEVQRLVNQARTNIMRRVQAEYAQASTREQMLKQALAGTKQEFDQLNARRHEYQQLKDQADADTKLYNELFTKIKEAGINSSFRDSSIRIADFARPTSVPIFPNYALNIGVAFLVSALLALGAAYFSDKLDNTVRDPEEIERTMSVAIMGSLPLVSKWRSAGLRAQRGLDRFALGGNLNGKVDRKLAGYLEAMRTLRNSILLSTIDRPLRTVLMTSAAPREGKSTTAIHMALVHAKQRKRTLLIDCDLRRPSVNRYLEIPPSTPGVADVLRDGIPWRDVLIKLEAPAELHILCAGRQSISAADLVGPGLQPILDEALDEYDMVIVDAAPLLGFAEPLHLATMVDAVVIVSLSGRTDKKAIAAVLSILNRVRANVVGIVLNEVGKDSSQSYHYYGYYGQYYSKYYTSDTSA